jgi:glutamate synthase domain-containing protein 3
LISPPPHHDIYSIEDLAQLIYDLKCVTGGSGDASRGEGILPSRLAGVSPASVSSSSSAAAVSVASSSGAVSSEQKAETEVETTEGKMPSGREGGTPSPRQTPRVKISVKLVSEVGVGTVAAGVAKGGADEVLISGYDGGTGASPLSSIKHAGVPWELGLAETQQTLLLNGLRDRILVQADGQMKTGRDVVVAALLGAERVGFGTAALVSLGCIMMRKCHQGTCPVGIGTQDEKLRKRFAGRPEHLRRFLLFVAEEVRRRMAELGFRRFEDMIGHVEKLAARKAVEHYKAKGLDFSNLFARPAVAPGASLRCVRGQPDVTAGHLDWEIIEKAQAVLTPGEGTGDRKNGDCTRFPSSENGGCPRFSGKSADSPDSQQKNGDRHDFQKTENGASPHFSSPHFSVELPIRNVNRTVGAILSHTIEKRFGAAGLPDGSLEVVLRGSAGQSFGAFLAPGVTLRLIGDANDYLGKGLSGGRIVVQAPENAAFEPGENIIAGNTLLYGATAGEAFVNGLAGERFAVRNSGVTAVVEGVGDHGCEYMTGGTVVVLGATGRNFAAGMSGGVAYVLDEHQLFDTLCNLDTVDLEVVWQEEDQVILRDLISRHARWTASARARRILDRWPEMVGRFVKVMPIDYRKAMERLREQERRGEEFSPATEEVFRG